MVTDRLMPIRVEIERCQRTFDKNYSHFIRHTPLWKLPGKALGVNCAEVWLKLEHLQTGGSFKARGMLNRLMSNVIPTSGVVVASGGKASLPAILSIMVLGISVGQAASWFILTRPPMALPVGRYTAATLVTLTAVFATFSYFPPRTFLFENFFCYQYTGDYGILPDYGPYRVFVKVGSDGSTQAGGGVNYCAGRQRPAPLARDTF